MKNFGEFFNNQIENAGTIVLSRTADMDAAKLDEVVSMLREKNAGAVIITTDWNALTGRQILEAMERTDTLEMELARLSADEAEDEHEHEHCHHHHNDDDDEHEHCCHHHHNDDDDDDEHEHCCHDHEGHHHHHHGHDADEVFVSWGVETPRKFTMDELQSALRQMGDEERFGVVLRAKGILPGTDGQWIHFDYVPGEENIRHGSAAVTGRLCVIGSHLSDEHLKALFGV